MCKEAGIVTFFRGNIRGLSKKYPTLGQKKYFTYLTGFSTLIPFKVGPLCLHTLSPLIFPLLETPLEVFFWNAVPIRRRVPHYLFSTLKTRSFQWRLPFWKQPDMARLRTCLVVSKIEDATERIPF